MRLLLLALLLSFGTPGFAQRCQTLIGVVGGVNFTQEHLRLTETHRRPAPRTGTQIGVVLAQRLNDYLVLGMEPTYVRRQLRYDPHRPATAGLRHGAFRLPVLAELRSSTSSLPVFAALQVGAAAALGTRLERYEAGDYTPLPTPKLEESDRYQLLDAGLQYGLKLGYTAGDTELYLRALRYNGFNDVARGVRSHTSDTQLSLGLTYRYARRRR